MLWCVFTGILSIYILGDLNELKRKLSLKGYAIGWGLAILALIAGSLLNILFNHHATAGSHIETWLLIITIIVPSLVGEELFTLSIFKACDGGCLGWIVSTLLFVSAHGFEYHMEYMAVVRTRVYPSGIY